MTPQELGDQTGLGRIPQHDDRNKKFPLPRKQLPRGYRQRYWWCASVLDQGGTPQCVGYAGWGWLAGGPVTNRPDFSPTDLYKWAQERDEWPGENYAGTSTLGLLKALRDKGYIAEYRWAYDAETIAAWVLTTGPILVGTWWHLDMANPHNETGFITPTGEKLGGHEYWVIGANRDKVCPDDAKGAFRIVNSHGAGWGQGGRAWIGFKDLEKLVQDDGEAAAAMELKLP